MPGAEGAGSAAFAWGVEGGAEREECEWVGVPAGAWLTGEGARRGAVRHVVLAGSAAADGCATR